MQLYKLVRLLGNTNIRNNITGQEPIWQLHVNGLKLGNARDTKTLTIFVTTRHVASCEW